MKKQQSIPLKNDRDSNAIFVNEERRLDGTAMLSIALTRAVEPGGVVGAVDRRVVLLGVVAETHLGFSRSSTGSRNYSFCGCIRSAITSRSPLCKSTRHVYRAPSPSSLMDVWERIISWSRGIECARAAMAAESRCLCCQKAKSRCRRALSPSEHGKFDADTADHEAVGQGHQDPRLQPWTHDAPGNQHLPRRHRSQVRKRTRFVYPKISLSLSYACLLTSV